jgi:hypothetical protein
VPYEDNAEKDILERYGGTIWERLQDQHGQLSLQRLYTALPEDRFRALIDEARRRDQRYRPPNFFTWFTADTPPGLRSEELAKALLAWELVEDAYPDAPAADPLPVYANDDPCRPYQGYLDPAPVGIDAEFAWTIPGGDGAKQRLVDLEQGWTLDHEDLSAHGASLLYGSLLDASRPHGTAVLGEICAVDNGLGCIGITPNVSSVEVVSHSGSLSNVSSAIQYAIAQMDFGDVLLLEVQTDLSTPPTGGAPVEIINHTFDAIRLATALGIIVVEAGGNGTVDLDSVRNTSGEQVLSPASCDFRDSGAIIVGAASSCWPHKRLGFSSFGTRVNCYAWGQNVYTADSSTQGATTLYTGSFPGTSAAAPIIAGAALAIQGIREAAWRPRFGPLQMRQLLSDRTTGTASKHPETDLIGVMPNLRSIITTRLQIGFADVYVRDYPGDTGDPHRGRVSSSPDVIVRPTSVANPQAAFGEGSGMENNETLGYDIDADRDNYVYVRLRNRGDRPSRQVEVTVYWSEVATLATPDMWNVVGSTIVDVVQPGDQLQVADAIVWRAPDIPASGHYCFVVTVGTTDDPVPPLPFLMNFDNFRAFVRNNNGVTWRNFHIAEAVSRPDAPLELPFLLAGAPDRAVPMGLEVIAKLPQGARLALKGLAVLPWRQRFGHPRKGGEHIDVLLRPQGRQDLGTFAVPAKYRAHARLFVVLPEEAQRTDGWQLIVRQYVAADREEIGRVTWHLVSPEFFERRKRLEEYLGVLGSERDIPAFEVG